MLPKMNSPPLNNPERVLLSFPGFQESGSMVQFLDKPEPGKSRESGIRHFESGYT
jgi:hypothetical protein